MLGWAHTAKALNSDSNSALTAAINKAGRQRMLSQRMSKAWLCLVLGVQTDRAKDVLRASTELFEKQLSELQAFAPKAEIASTYTQLGAAWQEFSATLQTNTASNAGQLLLQDSKVLALAHQGTQQLEAELNQPIGKLVNIAGRQRMLSQRMAKFYFVSVLKSDAQAESEIVKARNEFLSALETLKKSPLATPSILNELALIDGQWVFFNAALQKLTADQNRQRSMRDVLIASENILTELDKVTGQYAALSS
ncbi:type IV pili methyl-accepting chemotaxis transducer N-terminal domain-containing protein [Curvibacter sp. CHRR-16]|uniref:type IV pili methyl-accepting chemotaxis transducer N-terminal domain-containing protein n=1 Tax=Curvibacter sp. CHRR-16 TaxID=2835872 RepID=UPI0024DFB7F1|nr:type IV pili methyl-accepting chemotaxis transducer N-terminal domain-containing protein [Curvibacter sp. CHRR-16]